MTYKGTLVELGLDTIPVGTPLQFALRDESGNLLANHGYIIKNRAELEKIKSRGKGLMVDVNESAVALRAYLLCLNKMVIADKDLREIASAKLMLEDLEAWNPATLQGGFPDYLAYQARATVLLRRPEKKTFLTRINQLQKELTYFIKKYPDASIASMVYLSAKEMQNYSAIHAILVWVVATITARNVLKWDDDILESLGKAALTMNISMTWLQDELALQNEPLTEYQKDVINTHPIESRKLLLELGVTDSLWLDAVMHHRDQTPGALNKKSMGQQLGRLIQRADVFGARIAPRMHRQPLPITAAMQASYLDESKQPDEAGSAIVMALGVYAPGSFVKLATGETAIVTRRRMVRPGVMGKNPYVAILLNKDGFPAGNLLERDTSLSSYKIEGSVNARDVKVQIPLEKILNLLH